MYLLRKGYFPLRLENIAPMEDASGLDENKLTTINNFKWFLTISELISSINFY